MAHYLRSYILSDESARRINYDHEKYEQDGDFVYNDGDAVCITPPHTPFCKSIDPSSHVSCATNDTVIKYSKGELALIYKTSSNQLPSITSVITGGNEAINVGDVELTVNITTRVNSDPLSEGYKIRRYSIDNGGMAHFYIK